MIFETENFGKCEVICLYKDVALVALENNYEKYVITVGLSLNNKNWLYGSYCKNFELAEDMFFNIIQDFYGISFKI